MHVKWPDICSFHNVRKNVAKYPVLLDGDSFVHYQAKVKLHGINAAVQVRKGNKVFAQSKTRIISPGKNDNCGFDWKSVAKIVSSRARLWYTQKLEEF